MIFKNIHIKKFTFFSNAMRKRWRIILIIILMAAFLGRKQYHKTASGDQPSAIDKILQRTDTWSTVTGDLELDTTTTANNEAQYQWGGEYADFSESAVKNALAAGRTVVIVFEKNGDPTWTALHDDITTRMARIPKDTIIFFANFETETDITSRLEIVKPNTVIYLGPQWQEIRRKWNGIVSLAQIVSGIDGVK